MLLIFLCISSSIVFGEYFQGIELLSDVNYDHGFEVIPACHSDPETCSKAPRYHLNNPFSNISNQTATWQIAQWASHSNLSMDGTLIHDNRSEGMQWATADKRFILFKDHRLQLAVNAFHEYNGQYKPRDAPWVHLLVQQDIGRERGALPLSEVTELDWNLDIQLLYMDQHIQPGYNPNLHAAIFPLYMTIQNLIQGDPDYGKYFWLGIDPYDDRVLMSPLYVNGDNGTASLIYSPAFANFANKTVHSGEIVHVHGDMMPYVRLGLQAAFERGYLHSNDLSRYFVGGMNIGWEITGLNIGTIEFGSFSLKQYTAQNPKPYEFNRDQDREGWMAVYGITDGNNGPSNGYWIFIPMGDDPQILSPVLSVDTSVVKKIYLRLINNHRSDNQCQLFWSDDRRGSFNELASQWISTKNDGLWREYTIDLSEHEHWSGMIRRLRFDPIQSGDGQQFGIDYIRFSS